jgi:glycosyltransferase involved in cell wall biosynthesis
LLALLAATRALRAPIVFHDHRGIQMYAEVPRWFTVAQRYLAAYVGVDDAQRAWARRGGVTESRIHVIGNAVDFDVLSRQTVQGAPLAARYDVKRVIAVGSLRREKAIDVLLDAFARMTRPAVLHLVGGGESRYAADCRARAARSDLAGRVLFEGQREDALALARTADLAVHAARSESGPLVLAEYAGLGVPFVSTLVGGIAASLAGAGVARFVSPEDPAALAAALDELLAMPRPARDAMVEAARSHALRTFDIGVAMPHWYRIYDEVTR